MHENTVLHRLAFALSSLQVTEYNKYCTVFTYILISLFTFAVYRLVRHIFILESTIHMFCFSITYSQNTKMFDSYKYSNVSCILCCRMCFLLFFLLLKFYMDDLHCFSIIAALVHPLSIALYIYSFSVVHQKDSRYGRKTIPSTLTTRGIT